MAETPNNPEEPETAERSDLLPETGEGESAEGIGLSQDALDALLAAAAAEIPSENSEESALAASADETSFEGTGPASSGMDLPSFDLPLSGGAMEVLGSPDEPAGMARVRDIPLDVTVELGRTRLLIRDILDLSAGSIVELDKIAGEPVELFANGMLVARGEVIVIDDNFGVRVTEIITAADRHQSREAASLVAA
jgi:flagellar motor switch protein FliN